jgi:hypothetical protein
VQNNPKEGKLHEGNGLEAMTTLEGWPTTVRWLVLGLVYTTKPLTATVDLQATLYCKVLQIHKRTDCELPLNVRERGASYWELRAWLVINFNLVVAGSQQYAGSEPQL